jgi:succinyl-diaminopimelate desuccinylase
MTELDRILRQIDLYGDEIISLQAELTSRVALSPDNGGTGEHAKANYLKEKLEALWPSCLKVVQVPDDRAKDGFRPNLLAQWEGRDQERAIWVLSHMDVVPPGDLKLWEGDPYEVRVQGDKIYGRGVQDNQQGIVSSYLSLKAILDCGARPKRTVGLAMVADEETGSRYGLDYLLKNHGEFFKPEDLIVVPDAGDEQGTMIEVAEKSILWLKFTVQGHQCHASTPEKGRNSLVAAASLILELGELKSRFGLQDGLFKPPLSTFEPTKIEANVPNINTIPGRDVFFMDCRVLPHYALDDIIEAVQVLAGGLSGKLDVSIKAEPHYRQDAAPPTPVDAPVVEALARCVRRVTAQEAKPMGIGGGTVAAFFRKAGLPAAVWMTMSDTAHRPNEYCLISNIIKDAKVFACLYMGV